jgi:hypothetical protein
MIIGFAAHGRSAGRASGAAHAARSRRASAKREPSASGGAGGKGGNLLINRRAAAERAGQILDFAVAAQQLFEGSTAINTYKFKQRHKTLLRSRCLVFYPLFRCTIDWMVTFGASGRDLRKHVSFLAHDRETTSDLEDPSKLIRVGILLAPPREI